MKKIKGTAFALLSSTIVIFVGCSKSQENINKNSVVESGVVLSGYIDPKIIVARNIKYKAYDDNNRCNIRVNDNQSYCVNIDLVTISTENGTQFFYALEGGTPLDEKMEKKNAHVDLGSLKFYKFEMIKDNKLKLVAESDLLECGPYGNPCGGMTYKVGNGPELGWVITTGDMHQGYGGTYLTAYAMVNKKIQPILSVQTSSTNEGAVDSDVSDAKVSVKSTAVTTVTSAAEKFYDLEVVVSGKNITNKKATPINFTTTLKFDGKTNAYDSKSVAKIYDGAEY